MTEPKDTIDFFFDDPADALHIAQSHASTTWEIDFIEQQIARYERYGEKMFMTHRQAEIIRKIGRLDQ